MCVSFRKYYIYFFWYMVSFRVSFQQIKLSFVRFDAIQ